MSDDGNKNTNNKWPSIIDYSVAINNPETSFRDPEFKCAKPEVNLRTRKPKSWAGQFAVVYSLINDNNRWAVKCFHNAYTGIHKRYEAIAKFININKLSFFTDFEFRDKEILVNENWYPVVKMKWVDGESLDKYISNNLDKPNKLKDLAQQLTDIVEEMESKGIAHGDLQHGNILVQNDKIKLVDYDGIFIPEFAGQLSPEIGLPSYQHPKRTPNFYNEKIDRFSLLIICTTLYGVANDKNLWTDFNDQGKNLIFSKDDFNSCLESPCLKKLLALKNDKILNYLAEMLIVSCTSNLDEISRVYLSSHKTKPLGTNQNDIQTKPLPNIFEEPVQNNFKSESCNLYTEYLAKLQMEGRMPCNREGFFSNLAGCYFTFIEGTDFGRVFLLEKPEMVLGRSDEADIQLDDEKVSRKHLKLCKIKNTLQAKVVDLNSKNGVFVNGTRTYEENLRSGDKIKVGDTILKFEIKNRLDVCYHDELYQQATRDPLTGLSNRNYFRNELKKFVSLSARYNRALSVIMLDIDFFKKINDTYGHDVGDNVLKNVSEILMRHVRTHDVAARFGGEEFVMLLPETSLDSAVVIAERIRTAVENVDFNSAGCRHNVTISIGVAEYLGDGTDVEEVIKKADEALHKAKSSGRNRVCLGE